jgi:hypothetical protein
VKVVAWVLVVLSVASVVLGPFMIGEKRPPFTAGSYVAQLAINAVAVALAGHVLGWW